jgi:hypothetical protein
MNAIKNNQELFGLIEKNTYLIAGLSNNLSVINTIIESSLGVYFIMPYMLHRPGADLLEDSPWLCVIDPNNGNISRHTFNIDVTSYETLTKKISSLEKVSRDLSVQKNRYKQNNNDFTDLILLSKEIQANNYINGIVKETCYIEEHAAALNMTITQAAQDIIVRSSLMHKDFARIEGMKLKYFKLILASSVDQLPNILDKFRKECWFSN